jgi:hypothetical protein
LRFHGLRHSVDREMIDSDIDRYTIGKRMANNANEASDYRAFLVTATVESIDWCRDRNRILAQRPYRI